MAPMTTGAKLKVAQDKLANGELREALTELDALLQDTPEGVEALYLKAVTLRYLKEYRNALDTLTQLKAVSPNHSRAFQEEGHVFRDSGLDSDRQTGSVEARELALTAYTQAVALNPALESSLRELVRLLDQAGRQSQSDYFKLQLQELLELPQDLRMALDLMSQNKLVKAESICRKYLLAHPDHVGGMRLLAEIGLKLGVLEDAEFLLESAATFAPDNLKVRMDYVQILRKRQRFEAALTQAVDLLKSHPDNLQVRSMCAIEHMQTGDYPRAIELLNEVLEQIPGDARTLVTYGHALKTQGDTDQAIARYRQATGHQPNHGESYYSLANLKTYRFDPTEIEQMIQVERSANLTPMDRVHLNFALAKAYEDEADYARSFQRYSKGNEIKKSQSRYDAQQMHAEMLATKEICDQAFFAERTNFGVQSPDPIFVVGLPRAGSTLIEQILASHSQIDGTLELPNILSLSQRLRRRKQAGGYPNVLTELSNEECMEFGSGYIEDTRIHRAEAPYFVDKMPNNFRHIALIKLILPHAKIIDARREPMACCFSGFKQLFAEGQEFSYDLKDIGRYYNDYTDLMTHWDNVLPGFVLRVQHEDVVADLETEVRRMLEFCNLPFEEACLRFFETDRNIRTPSSEQVRQPIFSEGIEQWRHFEPWLSPLAEVLSRNEERNA